MGNITSESSRTTEDEKFVISFGTCNVEIDEPCSSKKVIFYIYTNDTVSNSSGVLALDPKLPSYFNESRETKILIHGYVGNATSKNTALLREAYVRQNKFNVVVVDWGELVKLPCYPVAVFSTWQAGKCTAIFLENFVSHGDFRKVHAIGFSLGAHVAAFASNRLKEKTRKELGRITGLDPALPFFASLEKAMKLDKEDGGFVDVIHTNVGVFGKIEPTGHVDFYMNGGFSQPACQKTSNVLLCSHLMAVVYYAETVLGSGRGFWGVPCASHFHYLIGLCNEYTEESRVEMGEKCDHSFICFALTEAEDFNKFPDGFLMGFSTASYQIEGAWNEDGKGENIWDRLVHTQPNLVEDHGNGDVACDSYHNYKEDIKLLENLGADIYRFSLSWARIFPKGDIYVINQAGVDYYNKIINALLAKNIQPMVTLYHWDLPQNLQNLGGWTNPLMVDYFEDYARFVFQQFGDRVKWWITFNEPFETCQGGYGDHSQAPMLGMTGTADYLCAHTILKSHARAFHLYSEEFRESQKGKISITLNGGWNEPLTDSVADKEAAERSLEFQIGWFLHPIIRGDYPSVMRRRVNARSKMRSRLPYFNKFWKAYIKGTIDYLGINHYSTYLATPSKNTSSKPSYYNDLGVDFSQNPFWPGSAVSWLKIEPKGFGKKIRWLKNYTDNFPIFITENGYADKGDLHDSERINYYELYLKELLNAIHADNCNVIGYAAWSLIDNFEWLSGYTVKFGVYRVDFANPQRQRTAKDSVSYFRELLATRVLPSHKIFRSGKDKKQLRQINSNHLF